METPSLTLLALEERKRICPRLGVYCDWVGVQGEPRSGSTKSPLTASPGALKSKPQRMQMCWE